MDRKPSKDLSCVVCSVLFYYKDPSNPIGSRCPLLLRCGHSICEGCMRSVTVRGSSVVECTICLHQSVLNKFKNPEELREEFPLNVYAVGQISLKRGNKPKLGDSQIGFYSQKKKTTTTQVKCDECGNLSADCSCRKCCANLCSPCFAKIHSGANTLKTHQKVNFVQSEDIAAAEAICKDHRDKTYNMYCDECDVYCCPDCDIKKHLKHSLIDVAEMNTEILPELMAAHEEDNSVLKHLLASRKKLKGTLADKEVELVEQQVSMHFNTMHGLLQLQEVAMLRRLRATHQQTAASIGQLSAQLDTSINEVETVLKASNALLENATQIPLSPLLKKLKLLASTPCFLVLGAEDDSILEFKVDPTIYEVLTNHCTLNVPENRSYELRTESDLPKGYVIIEDIESISQSISDLSMNEPEQTPVKPQNAPSIPSNSLPVSEAKVKKPYYQDVLRKNKVSLAKNNAELAMSATNSLSAENIILDAICSVPPLQEASVEIVRIIHLLTPNDFYIQRKSTQHLIEKLRENFTKFVKNKSEPRFIELGKMYLVQFLGDNKWYRAVAKNVDGNKYDIFYVDYGNKDTVPLSRIREIPEKYFNIPEQAIHCSLYGCVPVENDWTEQSVHLLTSMSRDVDLSVFVVKMNQASQLYEIQLRTTDDTNSSLADALRFLNCASKAENVNDEEGYFNPRCTLPSFQTNTVYKNETFMAQVTHINTPSNFFLQRISDAGHIFTKMMDDMNKVYFGLKYHELAVYNPKVGLPVAAKFTDGKWHRAKVVDIPQNRVVQVQYVDFGNIETVDWTEIRFLLPKYFRVGVQALKCSLSQVTSSHSKGWQNSAKKAFECMAPKNILLKTFVEDINDIVLSVILYQQLNGKNICINGLIVERGHALSVGPSSAHSIYPGDSNAPGSEADSASVKSSSNVTNRKRNLPSSPSASVTSNDTSLTTAEECAEDSRIKVKILKVVTPDEIYVAFEKSYKQILQLNKQMRSHYNYVVEEEQDWTEGEFCAVMKIEDGKRNWFRGIIQDVTDSKYKVYVKDTVDLLTVNRTSLRRLGVQFQVVPDGSFRCHMVGIRPPGGMAKWPGSTNDYVALILKRYPDLYITTLLNQEDTIPGSVPVQIWAKHRKYDPLAPMVEEWMNIASQLYNLGFVCCDPKCKDLVQDGFDFDTQDDFVKQWIKQSYEEASEAPDALEFEEAIQPTMNYRAKRENNQSQRMSRNLYEFEESSYINPECKTSRPAPSQNKNKGVSRLVASNQRVKVGLETIPSQVAYDGKLPTKDWIPATPFSHLDFIAWPTYVDENCAIYIQDIEKSRDKLDHIQKALSSLYEGTIPRPHDLMWFEGELCIAHYEVDKKWYRGKVVQVKDEKVTVLFVDYGNTEELLSSELRKDIALDHIPIQCHRCLTQGMIPVSSDGLWPTKTLDFIHIVVVEKACQVQLKIGESGEYVIMKITLTCGEDLLNTLVTLRYATYVIDCDKIAMSSETNEEELFNHDDPCSVVSSENSNNTYISSSKAVELKQDSFPSPTKTKVMDWFNMIETTERENEPKKPLAYNKFILPDGVVEVNVDVVAVSSVNTVHVSIVDSDDAEVKNILHSFDELSLTLQDRAPTLPVISNIYPGMPCLACYTEDNVWYRAIIKEVLNQSTVSVVYVDFQNEETLNITRLRGIKIEWMDVPVQSLEVTLCNIIKGPNYTENKVFSNMFIKCISTSSPPFTMIIEARQPSLQCELYSTTGELLYQPLIDVGFLAKN